MAKKVADTCGSHCCRGRSTSMLVLGLLILGNAYLGVASWGMFIGAAVTVCGLMGLLGRCK